MSRNTFKAASLLAGTALVALSMSAGQATADTKLIQSKNKNTVMKFGGHVSRQITILDDGRTAVRHSDSDFSSSRFVIDAASKLNADIKVGSRIETAVDDARNSPARSADSNGGRTGNDLRTRKAEIHFTHKTMGKLWIGAGDMASNGATETSFTNYTMLPGFIAGTNNGAFRNNAATTATNATDLSGATVGNTTGQPDGLGRSTRVRYDTPKIMGFMASTSHEDNQDWDIALRYGGKFMDTKIKASVAHSENDVQEQLGGSFAVQHASGLGATYGFEIVNPENRSDTRGNDPFYQNMQLHYTTKMNTMGTTQFAYMYSHHENERTATSNEVAATHSVGVYQKIDAAAMEMALRWTHTELSSDTLINLDNDSVSALSIHTRLKF